MRGVASRILSSPGLSAIVILSSIVLIVAVKVIVRTTAFGAVDLIAMWLPLAMLVPAIRQFARRQWLRGTLSLIAIPVLLFVAMIVVFVGWRLALLTRGTTWYSASAELPDGLGQLTLSYRSALPPSFFPVPGGEVVCKVEVRRAHAKPQTVDLGFQPFLPDVTVSVVEAASPILHLSYVDQNRYIDAASGHLVEPAEGPERKLGMFWQDHALGGLRFVRYEERPSIHGGLAGPYAVAVGNAGRIYVADEAYQVLVVYSASGEFLDKRSLPGIGGYDIAIDRDENLWLVQWGQPELRKYAPDGRVLAEHKEPFDCASGLAIGKNRDIYVSDIVSLVYRISPEGDVLTRWGLARGDPPRAPGVKYAFCGIAVLPDGNVVVADRNAGRIRVYSSDGDPVKVWKVRTRRSWLDTGAPTDVAVDSRGNIYAPVWGRDGLQLEQYTAKGEFVRRWASGIGRQEQTPVRIAVNDKWLYVIDRANGRIRRFTKDGEAVVGW
jgi:DNA-binding beta-propeller fold protein YncE